MMDFPVLCLRKNIEKLLHDFAPDCTVDFSVDLKDSFASYNPNTKEIRISCFFMNYVWLFCFYGFYNQEKCNEEQMRKNNLPINESIKLDDKELQKTYYTISNEMKQILLSKSTIKEINTCVFPRIDIQKDENVDSLSEFTVRTNAIFVRAITFCLLHEIGHKTLEHKKKGVDIEIEADRFALDRMFTANMEELTLLNNFYGSLSAFLAIICQKDIHYIVKSSDHPPLTVRLKTMVAELKKYTTLGCTVYLEHYCANVLLAVLLLRGEQIDDYDAGDDMDGYLENLFRLAEKHFVLNVP